MAERLQRPAGRESVSAAFRRSWRTRRRRREVGGSTGAAETEGALRVHTCVYEGGVHVANGVPGRRGRARVWMIEQCVWLGQSTWMISEMRLVYLTLC